MKDQEEPFQVNDFDLDVDKGGNKTSKINLYFLIGAISFFVIILIVSLLLINQSDEPKEATQKK